MKTLDKVLLGLILINIIVSLYVGLTSGTDAYICNAGAGCDIVQKSDYSFIFGIKVAWFGVACFLTLLGAFFLIREKYYWIFFGMTTIGFIFALYFLYVQIFIIKAICQNCFIIDIVSLIIFFISAYEMNGRIDKKRA